MLFDLKQKTKKKDFADFIAGFAPKFDPLDLASYQAGYLMNLTTDVPAGSINPNAVAGQWYDAKILGAGSKLLQRGNNTTTGLINGFKNETLLTSTSRLQNTTLDILTGVFDFSFLIGFKRVVPGVNGAFILTLSNTVNNPYIFLALRDNTHLKLDLGAGAIFATVETALTYTDNIFHVAICLIDQSNKTVSLYTDRGEVLTNQNLLITTNVMTPNSQTDFNLGQYSPAPAAGPFYPGEVGDLLVFNSILTLPEINLLMTWEKTRLGI